GDLAPHVRAGPNRGCGPQPAPRDAGALAHEPFPVKPSFNERNVSDKPKQIQKIPPFTPALRQHIVTKYRCRQESLLAVDRGVAKVMAALAKTGALSHTDVIYTSDNGLQQGEHRLKGGKQQPYEESLRVPLVIRGPGIP